MNVWNLMFYWPGCVGQNNSEQFPFVVFDCKVGWAFFGGRCWNIFWGKDGSAALESSGLYARWWTTVEFGLAECCETKNIQNMLPGVSGGSAVSHFLQGGNPFQTNLLKLMSKAGALFHLRIYRLHLIMHQANGLSDYQAHRLSGEWTRVSVRVSHPI